MERLDRYLIGLVPAHFVVNLVHATAHFGLQILPAGLDLVFILVVILVGPIVALVILRFNPPLAAGLLAVLMGASFVYRVASHLLRPRPSHGSLPGAPTWAVSFGATRIPLRRR